jgi:hypothetical protein
MLPVSSRLGDVVDGTCLVTTNAVSRPSEPGRTEWCPPSRPAVRRRGSELPEQHHSRNVTVASGIADDTAGYAETTE